MARKGNRFPFLRLISFSSFLFAHFYFFSVFVFKNYSSSPLVFFHLLVYLSQHFLPFSLPFTFKVIDRNISLAFLSTLPKYNIHDIHSSRRYNDAERIPAVYLYLRPKVWIKRKPYKKGRRRESSWNRLLKRQVILILRTHFQVHLWKVIKSLGNKNNMIEPIAKLTWYNDTRLTFTTEVF